MSDNVPYVRLQRVAKRFGRSVALRGVSLRVDAGEVVAVLGTNGAGKTTLLRTIATLARPSRGTAELFGLDPWRQRREVRARIGVVA
ncbi:MAG: sodium ABC transporter ATP-binding protein, partial [Chloroflexi bacterium]